MEPQKRADGWRPPPRFRDVRTFSSGGMGELSLADDTETGLTVVIKRPRFDTRMAEEQVKARFRREQRLILTLSHPQIAKVVDAGEWNGELYLVFEFVPGRDLRERMAMTPPLSVVEAVNILDSTCRAVAYLHEQEVLHRDIQPGNILLGEDGGVKVTDFGLAAPLDGLGVVTQTGEVLGTADYISPEQRHRLPVDQRSDLYSIAALGYEMLTGVRATGLFPPPSELNSKVPKTLDRVLMRGLQRDPAERHQSVEQFRQALQAAAPGPAADRRSRWLRIAAAASLLILIVAVLMATVPPNRPPRAEQPAEEQGNEGQGNEGQGNEGQGNEGQGNEGLASNGDPSASGSQNPGIPIIPLQPNPQSKLALAVAELAARDASEGDESPARIKVLDEPLSPQQIQEARDNWSEHLGVPQVIENSIGMRFSLVPPGTFMMGLDRDQVLELFREEQAQPSGSLDPAIDPEAAASQWVRQFQFEAPRHEVTIGRPIWIGIHEVTVGQFQKFVAAENYQTEVESNADEDQPTWKSTGFAQTDDHPVSLVTEQDCQRFCEWLSKVEGVTYRLLTEAEWEYACRAGTTTRYWFGDDAQAATDYAWCAPIEQPTPVGKTPVNPFGLHDMHGNVWELVQDNLDITHYQRSAGETDPVWERSSRFGRVLRGGSFGLGPRVMRSTTRYYLPRGEARVNVGFRVRVVIAERAAAAELPQ